MLESKLKDLDRHNSELQDEANSLQRIQNEQSKALEKISEERNYPGKIRQLLKELKEVSAKNKHLEESIRSIEDNKKKSYS